MGDVFKEQLVKREPNKKDLLIKGGTIVLAIVLCIFIFIASTMVPIVSQILPFAVLAIGFLAYYIINMKNVEYEYVFTNGDLDIDCIYNKSKRKRVFSIDVRNFEVLAPINDSSQKNIFDSATDKKDFTSGKIKDNTYTFVCTYNGKKTRVNIEPNEMFLQAMGVYVGQRKFIKKI